MFDKYKTKETLERFKTEAQSKSLSNEGILIPAHKLDQNYLRDLGPVYSGLIDTGIVEKMAARKEIIVNLGTSHVSVCIFSFNNGQIKLSDIRAQKHETRVFR